MRAFKLTIRVLASLAVSGVLMWLSLRNADLRAVGRAIASASPGRMAGYAAILVGIHLVRTIRWGILLEPLGHVGFKRLNSASAVGFMLLILLPFRLGEFARPLLIARPPPGARGAMLRRSGAFASIVVERIVDGLAIGVLGIVALRMLGTAATGHYADFARHASVLVALGFFALCVAVTLAFFLRDRAVQLTSAIVKPVAPRLAHRLSSALDTFISALHLGSGWKAFAFFALTALYWSLNGFGLWLLAPGFGFRLDALMIATILAVQVVGVMVPAGPGMIGTMQFFTQAGLSLFVPDAFARGSDVAARAAGFANTVWMFQFGVQVALGCIFMLLGHVSLRGLLLTRAPADQEGDVPAAAAP
ncbi:MAG TPA: lysylphosphatidylglycerol synthase transmembrane domain-containing protein [Myxococcales bacterium]|nr:lysylphosphatidylglycerol synthase transmembrane domain-containing protein [Myxococcales bacterium]